MDLLLWFGESGFFEKKIVASILSIVVVTGVVLNVYVVYRMNRLRRNDKDQFLNGTGVFLFVMASNDTLTLLLSHLQFLIGLFPESLPLEVMSILCKISEFMIRCSYTYSMYSWIFMSGLRYLAAIQPYEYITSWRAPISLLCSCGISTMIVNLFHFTNVDASLAHRGCVLKVESATMLYSSVDILVSTIIPTITILVLDLQVLCCRPRRKASASGVHVVYHTMDDETVKRRQAMMRRFMLFTFLSLCCSIPDSLLRGFRLFFKTEQDLTFLFYVFKILYLAKLCFNASYLSFFVFDRNVLSKTSSSRHLSASCRRLDDEPAIVQRERSRTLSCRGTSPIPILTRNSSCILYNDAPESPGKLWV